MKSKLLIISFFLLFAFSLYGESEGEKLFKQNKPGEAIIKIEAEIAAGTASANGYNYLGLSYYQLGEYEKSVEAFALGLKTSGTNKKILSFNQGNSYYAMGQYENAAKSFNLAYLADPNYYAALLNRANANLMANKLSDALADYKSYIALNPEDVQKDRINEMIGALSFEIQRRAEEERLAAEEAARIAEEERKFAEEQERLRQEEEARLAEEKRLEEERLAEEKRIEEERKAEERRKEEERLAEERKKEEARVAEEKKREQERLAAEAERRRKLLEEVANSLHNTDSTNMSSGAEELIEYEQEAELD